MSEILQFFADAKDSVSGVNQVIILASTLGAAILFLLRKTIVGFRKRRFLIKRLMPFYVEREIERATRIYVPTRCQNVDPAQEDEPKSTHAYVTKNQLIPLLTDRLQSGLAAKYYIVLADTGMGKTTFMINFFLHYARKWRARYEILLFPLGDSRTDAAIDDVEDKQDKVLLLDAFDEDGLAISDYGERLDLLIEKTRDFRCVVMSSRTQFFPSHVEEPAKTGVLKHGGEKGEHEFKKLYLSPFDDRDIGLFIGQKYAWYQFGKRRQTRNIVESCPYLVVRPMLLSYIEDLTAEDADYNYPHQIYEVMVQRWIERERVENKDDLRRFSEAIALHMYRHQKERKGLFVEPGELADFARQHNIKLEEFELKSRSLLNRDAQGRLKFAHKSILEYLLALELLRNPEAREEFEIHRMEFAGFILESLRKAYLESLLDAKSWILPVDLGTGTYSELELDLIYTPLLTIPVVQNSSRMPLGYSAVEQLDRHARLVILGGPGSGKSTFLKFVTACLAGEQLGLQQFNLNRLVEPVPTKSGSAGSRRQAWKHGALLPVLIHLPELAQELPADGASAEDLWRFLAMRLGSARIGSIAPDLRRELEQAGLLLLDGLHEVHEPQQDLIYQVVKSFCETYPTSRVVITHRDDESLEAWVRLGFEKAELAPFHMGQVHWLLSQFLGQLGTDYRENIPVTQSAISRAIANEPAAREIFSQPKRLVALSRKSVGQSFASALTDVMQASREAPKLRLTAGLLASDLGDLPADLDAWVEIPADRLEYAFKIGKYPVTNAQFHRFVAVGGYDREHGWFSEEAQQAILESQKAIGKGRWPTGPRFEEDSRRNRATLPVTGISWFEATAYATWLTAELRKAGDLRTNETVRLATVSEWQRACGGVEDRPYSWGEDFDTRKASTKRSGLDGPTPVHMYPDGATAEGAFDLTGNVWEWTADKTTSNICGLAGGSYYQDAERVGSAARLRFDGLNWSYIVGFRVVIVPISRAVSDS